MMMSAQASPKTLLNQSAILSTLSLIAWILPIVGVPVSVAGIITSNRAYSQNRNSLSIFWLFLSLLGLAASLVNGVVGFQNGYKWGKQLQSQVESGQQSTSTSNPQSLQTECLNQAFAEYSNAWKAADKDGDGKLSPLDGSVGITTEHYNDQIDCHLRFRTADSDSQIGELRIRRQQEADKFNAILEALGNSSR